MSCCFSYSFLSWDNHFVVYSFFKFWSHQSLSLFSVSSCPSESPCTNYIFLLKLFSVAFYELCSSLCNESSYLVRLALLGKLCYLFFIDKALWNQGSRCLVHMGFPWRIILSMLAIFEKSQISRWVFDYTFKFVNTSVVSVKDFAYLFSSFSFIWRSSIPSVRGSARNSFLSLWSRTYISRSPSESSAICCGSRVKLGQCSLM